MDLLKSETSPALGNSASAGPASPAAPAPASGDALRVDPEAMATYSAIANSVSQQLTDAASVAAGAVDAKQLIADLGVVGADFAAKFTAAVSDHAQALSTAGRLVSAYGSNLDAYTAGVQGTDAHSAAAIGKTEQQI